MKVCPRCGLENPSHAESCAECNADLLEVRASRPPQSTSEVPSQQTQYQQAGVVSMPTRWVGGQLLVLIGSIMLLIGPFLPWATAGIFSASGMTKTGNEAIILTAIGIAGLVLALVSLAAKRSVFGLLPFVIGVAGAALSVYYYWGLRSDLEGFENEVFSASIGVGVYLCILASIIVLIGAALSVTVVRKR